MLMEESKSEKNTMEVAIVSEDAIQNKIYTVRGYKVMLDVDLAEIYGYETKNFNRQVKNNMAKFEGDDFMFQLTKDEWENLRCKYFTSSWGGSRYLPLAFTEQGIYMLMTVLRGEPAIKQSRALVRTFKKMKDYIWDNRELIGQREYIQLSMQTAENTCDIHKLKLDMCSVEKQMCDVMDCLGDVVTKSDLTDMMNSFVDKEDNGWLMYNTKYCAADLAYSGIYGQAKKTIYVVDNYIGLRTLVLLKNAPAGVDITLFSDNVGNRLHKVEYNDFLREYPAIQLKLKKTGGIYHDRFIVLDYGTKAERIFLCGASSKDAGARVTCIVEDFGTEKYKGLITRLMKNQELVLT